MCACIVIIKVNGYEKNYGDKFVVYYVCTYNIVNDMHADNSLDNKYVSRKKKIYIFSYNVYII